MCFTPNLRINGEFAGGLRKFLTMNKDGSQKTKSQQEQAEQALKEMLKKDKAQIVPCGKCLQCRVNYAQTWATRISVESQYHKHSYFLTLTYKEEEVPVVNMITGELYRQVKDPVDYVNGKMYERMTLLKKDMQDYIKRLRKQANQKGYMDEGEKSIRLFYCGEYGPKTFRPHYHGIFMGFQIPDLKMIPGSGRHGNVYFRSEWMESVWKHGAVIIGDASFQSAQYVARYAIKKQIDAGKVVSENTGETLKELYQKAGIQEEFISMSKKPGLGSQYYQDHKEELYNGSGKIYLQNGRIVGPPKYFDMLRDAEQYKKERGEALQQLEADIDMDVEAIAVPEMHSQAMKDKKQERRKKANEALFAEMKGTTKSLMDYLDTKADAYRHRKKAASIRDKI